MKTFSTLFLFLLLITGNKLNAQDAATSEKYGKTLNAGIGVGYYGYIGHTLPVLSANFEFDVAGNFTLAPFITVYSYQNYYYWGNPDKPYRDYSYRTTVVPVGVKGTYYFDHLLKAGPKWDFYLAGSLGFAFRKTTWESTYDGSYAEQHSSSGLYIDGHIGTEFHMTKRAGLFLDLSTGISTFGLAFHL
jgi:hypothetical protein